MRLKTISISITMAGLLLTSICSAQAKVWDMSKKENHPSYIGGGVGYGSGDADGIGLAAYGGYNFNQNIAAEGDFFVTPAFNNSDHAYTFAASGKFSFPIPNRIARHWTPYAQGGMAFTHWPAGHGTHVGLLVGGGVDYRLQHNIELGGKVLASMGDNNPVVLLATAAYRF